MRRDSPLLINFMAHAIPSRRDNDHSGIEGVGDIIGGRTALSVGNVRTVRYHRVTRHNRFPDKQTVWHYLNRQTDQIFFDQRHSGYDASGNIGGHHANLVGSNLRRWSNPATLRQFSRRLKIIRQRGTVSVSTASPTASGGGRVHAAYRHSGSADGLGIDNRASSIHISSPLWRQLAATGAVSRSPRPAIRWAGPMDVGVTRIRGSSGIRTMSTTRLSRPTIKVIRYTHPFCGWQSSLLVNVPELVQQSMIPVTSHSAPRSSRPRDTADLHQHRQTRQQRHQLAGNKSQNGNTNHTFMDHNLCGAPPNEQTAGAWLQWPCGF